MAQLRVIFWFEYCWGCCRELGGGWNELGGGGWNWVELGAWFSNALLKVVLHTRLNVYWESSGGSRFVIHSLLVLYKWSQTRSTPCTNLIFPRNNFYQSVRIPIQNNMHCWWIEIKKSPKYKLNDNIGDLSKTTFWYHSNDTKRNPWVMLCSHCPINDSSGYLHITVYLAVMLQASWHTAEDN